MFTEFKRLADNNFEKISEFVKINLETIHNVDVCWHEKVNIEIGDFKLDKFESSNMFIHLLLNKTIAQISLNLYKNFKYHSKNKFDRSMFIGDITDKDGRKEYEAILKELSEPSELSIVTLLRNVSIYLIVSKIFLNMEGLPTNQSKNNGIVKWTCFYCQNLNDKDLGACSICEGERVTEDNLIAKSCARNIYKKTYEKNDLIDDKGDYQIETTGSSVNSFNSLKTQSSSTGALHANVKDETLSKYLNRREDVGLKFQSETKKNQHKLSKVDLREEVPCQNSNSTILLNCHRDIRCATDVQYGLFNDDNVPRNTGSEGAQNKDLRSLCQRCEIKYVNIDKSKVCGCCANELFLKEKESRKSNIAQSDLQSELCNPNQSQKSVNTWKCDECGQRNMNSEDKCTKCAHHGAHYDKWICDKCSGINDKLDEVCQICLRSNPFIMKCSNCNRNKLYDELCRNCSSHGTDVQVNNNRINMIENLEEQLGNLHIGTSPASKHLTKNARGTESSGIGEVALSMEEEWRFINCDRFNSYDDDKCPKCDRHRPHYDMWRYHGYTEEISEGPLEKCDASSVLKPSHNKCLKCNVNEFDGEGNALCKDCASDPLDVTSVKNMKYIARKAGDKCISTNQDERINSMENTRDSGSTGVADISPVEDQWKCINCNKSNSYDDDKCPQCQNHGPHYDRWRCDGCTTINERSAEKCDTCSAVNPFHNKCLKCTVNDLDKIDDALCRNCSSDTVGVENNGVTDVASNIEEEWKCGKCGKSNLYYHNICPKCADLGPHYDKWRCQGCTKINGKLDKICELCDASNPFIRKCRGCYRNHINEIYDTLCTQCRRDKLETIQPNSSNMVKSRSMTAYSDTHLESVHHGSYLSSVNIEIGNKSHIEVGEPPKDGWSCTKCSFVTPWDNVKCGECGKAGPHLNKWRCSKCSVLNNWWDKTCPTCEVIPKTRTIYIISEEYSSFTINIVDTITACGKRVTEGVNIGTKVVCMVCGECCLSPLCFECDRRYFICDKSNCKTICFKDDDYCIKCGIRRYACPSYNGTVECRVNGVVQRMWLCSFEQCKALNKDSVRYCSRCYCRRYDSCYHRCYTCGWIELNSTYNYAYGCYKCKH